MLLPPLTDHSSPAPVAPVIAKVRDMKVRLPVSQPFMKNTRPEAEV